jgi:hypothetical protein
VDVRGRATFKGSRSLSGVVVSRQSGELRRRFERCFFSGSSRRTERREGRDRRAIVGWGLFSRSW